MTEAEIKQMLRTASHEGSNWSLNRTVMHEKVFYFAEKKARHIMTHRHDVEWIDLDMHPDEVAKGDYICKSQPTVSVPGRISIILLDFSMSKNS
jgi:CBS domain containing-hemolysin-like protein